MTAASVPAALLATWVASGVMAGVSVCVGVVGVWRRRAFHTYWGGGR